MTRSNIRAPIGLLLYFALTFVLGLYFAYASVQGDFGLFRRIEIEADAARLDAELDALRGETAQLENLTLRLSDRYLDLDLLDERARDVLGLVRRDEIVLR